VREAASRHERCRAAKSPNKIAAGEVPVSRHAAAGALEVRVNRYGDFHSLASLGDHHVGSLDDGNGFVAGRQS
jgi:hypothetical protein